MGSRDELTEDLEPSRSENISDQREDEDRLDAAMIDARVDEIRRDVDRRARNRAEREAGPLVERHCATCGYEMRAPSTVEHAFCSTPMCVRVRMLVPMAGEGRVRAFLVLAEQCDQAAATWLTYDPSRPDVMRRLAARARADADGFRRLADEASGTRTEAA